VFFDVIARGAEFSAANPHPDIYMRVAEKLHAVPDECPVIVLCVNSKRCGLSIWVIVTSRD